MSKNIVLLSDGTGNSSASLFKTNVWRLFQILDLRDPKRQIAFYDDGVGTSSFRLFAILGGIFGGGKGAAIGAAAGAGAGTGVSAATKGQQILLKPEAVLAFQLTNSITVTPGTSRQAMQ